MERNKFIYVIKGVEILFLPFLSPEGDFQTRGPLAREVGSRLLSDVRVYI